MNTLQNIALGTFEVTQSELIISDPCYKRGTWCMGAVSDVHPGVWEAKIGLYHEGKHDTAVAYLAAFHEDCPPREQLMVREEFFEVGVDSGQAGIFDSLYYRGGDGSGQVPDETAVEEWYNACCHQTLHTKYMAGTIPHGAVSSSGYGDGGYACLTYKSQEPEGPDTTWGVVIDFDVVHRSKVKELLLR